MANPKKPKKADSKKLPVMSKEPIEAEESTFQEPEVKTFSMVRRPGGWSLVTLVTQGDKVVSKSYTEPDAKNVAKERLLIVLSREFEGA